MSCRWKWAAATLPIVVLASAAAADPVFMGSTRMLFSDPVPEMGGIIDGSINNAAASGGVSTFEHGTAFSGSSPNVLTVDGADGFSSAAGSEFVLADLSYLNGQTVSGTAATGVTGALEVEFSAPPGLMPPQSTFSFSWTFTLTPNIGTPEEQADLLSVDNAIATEVFVVDGVQYTLEILGFREVLGGGGLGELRDEWLLLEDTTVHAALVGQFTTAVVPLPTAAGLGLLGLTVVGTRRNRRC